MIKKLFISILVFIVFLYPQILLGDCKPKFNSEILNIVMPYTQIISENNDRLEEIKKSLRSLMPRNEDKPSISLETLMSMNVIIANLVSMTNLYSHDCELILLCTLLPENTDYNKSCTIQITIERLKTDDSYFEYVINVLREAYGSFNKKASLHLLDKLKDNYISTRNAISRCVERLEALKQAHK